MLQISPQHRLLLAVEPVDFRAGIDGLKAVCQQHLSCDPFNGTIFCIRQSGTNISQTPYVRCQRILAGTEAVFPRETGLVAKRQFKNGDASS